MLVADVRVPGSSPIKKLVHAKWIAFAICLFLNDKKLFLNAYNMAARPLADKFQYVSESLGQQLSKKY